MHDCAVKMSYVCSGQRWFLAAPAAGQEARGATARGRLVVSLTSLCAYHFGASWTARFGLFKVCSANQLEELKLRCRVSSSVSSATFCFLAGVSAFDEKAAAATPPLPPVDSINMWGLISGANKTSPRREWALTPFGQLLYYACSRQTQCALESRSLGLTAAPAIRCQARTRRWDQ